MIKRVFAPGCALVLYKPELADRIHSILNENLGKMDLLTTCCHFDPGFETKTEVINVCPGCDKRFGNNYQGISTISLWEILAGSTFFNFPDYNGMKMSILDACPTRNRENVHEAVRVLLRRMNIELLEPEKTGTHGTCCGDSFYGSLSTEKVKEQMKKRASEMPLDDVVVYCVSCIKSVYNGGKNPFYLVDLLFADKTVPGTFDPDEWHRELETYIGSHAGA